jgi:hypothetical protein
MRFYSHIGLWLRRFQATLYHLLDFANSIRTFSGESRADGKTDQKPVVSSLKTFS